MPSSSVKTFRRLRPGARCIIAAGLLGFLAASAHADEALDGCEIDTVTPSGRITVKARDGENGAVGLTFRLTGEEDVVGADGSTARLDLSGMTMAPFTRDAIPGLLDGLMLTLHLSDANKIDAPALVYYTRDNTIPLDVAPAKLWFPGYPTDDGRVGLLVTLGDLEQHMAWGSGEEPASVLSWTIKKVGTSYYDTTVIDTGEIPMEAIRKAREAMGEALERVAEAQKNGPC